MEISKNTVFYPIELGGVSFIAYKHWSYSGNEGLYLMAENGARKEDRLAELVKGQLVKIKFSEKEVDYLKLNYSTQVLDLILPTVKPKSIK